MSAWWWSWLLTAVGVTGFVLAGRKVWWCWYVNLGCQGLWLTYALITRQYGFIVAAAVYVVGLHQERDRLDPRAPAPDRAWHRQRYQRRGASTVRRQPRGYGHHRGAAMTDVLHVVTDLGPTDGPGLIVPAQLGRITSPRREFINGVPIYRFDPWKDTP